MKKFLFLIVTVLGVNQLFSIDLKKGPIASDDYTTSIQNNEVKINFLSNDVNQSGVELALNYIIINEPQHGKIVDIDEAGNLVYQPNKDFIGEDKIMYYVIDPLGASSEMAKMVFNVAIDSTSSGFMSKSNKISKSMVYPNPVLKNATIRFEGSTLGLNKVYIYEITGRQLKAENLSFNANYVINSDEYLQGIYFYQLRNQNNELLSSGKFEVLK